MPDDRRRLFLTPLACVGWVCVCLAALGIARAQIYDGKVYGIFDPLAVAETPSVIAVSGGTFRYEINRASGQISEAV